MKKIITIIGIIVGAGILFAGVYYAFFAPAAPTGNSISIPTTKGQLLKVNDFTQQVQTKTETSDILAETPQFSISYFTKDKAFLITLESTPLKDARLAAEKTLLDKLGISQGDLCSLNTSVKVPYEIDQNFAGNELGLSFCPNSIQF